MNVYKYRSAENIEIFNRDLNTLLEDRFYASSFNELNDPFEGDFDEKITVVLDIIKDVFKDADASKVVKAFEAVKKFSHNLGIYSLSYTCINELLWAHYAGSHNGYCLEYQLEKITDKYYNDDIFTQVDVEYVDIVPSVEIDDILTKKAINKMYGTKFNRWQYENEIRILFEKKGLKKYHPSALKSVYFGLRLSEEKRKKIINSLTGRNVKFYKLKKVNNSYKLEFELIHQNAQIINSSIDNYEYEIIFENHFTLVENYYIYFKNNNYTEEELMDFCLEFKKIYTTKNANINLFDSKVIIPFINRYPLSDNEYIIYADHYIAALFDGTDFIDVFPFKDFKYNKLTGVIR